MRLILVIFLLLLIKFSFCQISLYHTVSKNVCSCLADKKGEGLSYKVAVSCINTEMENISEDFRNQMTQEYGNDISAEESTQFAKEFGLQVALELIDSCPNYRGLMDTARYSLYSYLNRDSVINQISILNSKDSLNRNLNFFVKRAKMLFWISDFKNAEKDAENILKLDSTNQLALHIKAINLEIKDNYASALKIYNFLYYKYKNPRYEIDAALVKWKIKK